MGKEERTQICPSQRQYPLLAHKVLNLVGEEPDLPPSPSAPLRLCARDVTWGEEWAEHRVLGGTSPARWSGYRAGADVEPLVSFVKLRAIFFCATLHMNHRTQVSPL